ncbi:erythromycin esterase family protein [Myroides sp. DF42-4-2]|uniref:erythromycin esterase family protein n=1 Tax=Myroides sp. DF42-4-2 TaxID=2746726 RepID=UPI002575FEA2|nr:erythromycin esterase family protein [Myroides sp. DF42-4-2]
MLLMVKTITVLLLAIAALLSSCQEATVEKQIASYMIPFEQVDQASFEEIAQRIGDSEIVILGEAGHGDGKTYEVKAELVQYLMKEKGFNTLALEGAGFVDLELKNNDRKDFPQSRDLSKWKPFWGDVKQTEGLVRDILHNEKLKWKFLGLESHPSNEFLLQEMKKLQLDDTQIDKFENSLLKIYDLDVENVTIEEIDFVLETIKLIENSIIDTTHDNFFKHTVQTIYAGIEGMKYFYFLGGFDNENVFVNIRDKYMANNVIWHKKNNPSAKIIVWIANFHGAKQIQKVVYKEDNRDLYKGFKLFTEYLLEAFPDKIYSIAFTSSIGEVKGIVQGSEPFSITTKVNSLEYYLDKQNTPFGYLDFNEIKVKKPFFEEKSFDAMILGYDTKPGQWLNVFDGVFYIKTNEPLKMAEYQVW